MSTINSFKELLLDELNDLHNAETQMVNALPKLAKAATNPELKAAFVQHLEETKGHVARLEHVFRLLREGPVNKICQAMRGLITEVDEAIKLKGPDAVRDADLIGAAQRVEHYEISAYGTARTFAELLNQREVAALLQQTLDEETSADQKLTKLSQRVNESALQSVGA
jgi:ferritin-like metal-binding protein YciE